MTPEQIQKVKEELQDALDRNIYWYRGKQRNDILQTALTIIKEYKRMNDLK